MRYSSTVFTVFFSATVAAFPLFAQQAPVASAVKSSQPGRVDMSETIRVSATIIAIDKATRTVTLKLADGRIADVVAGDAVKNFNQIKVGDEIVVEYIRSLSLDLKKTSGVREYRETSDSIQAKPGDKPGVAAARQIVAVADVIDVNPEKKTITLKGPKGKVIELNVQDPEQFKVVKKGDQVEAVFTEAIAIAVEPVAKPANK